MKNILLSSAAIVAIAGAASAEVSWSGDAELGYNDDVEDGIYWDAGLGVDLSQELNNGWTASASLDIDLVNDDSFDLGSVDSSDWVVTISNDVFELTAGDIDLAASKFSFVANADEDLDGDEASDFDGVDLDDDDEGDTDVQAGIMLSADFGAYNFAVSTIVNNDGDATATQFHAGAELGAVELGVLYTEEDIIDTATLSGGGTEDFGQAEILLVSAAASLGGADFTANAGEVGDVTVYGLEVAYPVGDVTLGAYYVGTDLDGDDTDAYGVSADYAAGAITVAAFYEEVFGDEGYGLEASYDLGNGLVVGAGHIGGDNEGGDQASYIVAEYDLGGGASFLASYADAETEGADDIDTGIGGYELLDGVTLELSLEF